MQPTSAQLEDEFLDYSNATPLAMFVIGEWVDHPNAASPHDLHGFDDWRNAFRRIGPHHACIYGEMDAYRDDAGRVVMVPTHLESYVQRVDSLRPPEHLYRAARPGGENRWNWFEEFDTAKLMLDDVGGGLEIWACEPGEVFAKITLDRVEPGGYRRQWNEWVVEPTNVRKISRWRDPFTEIPNRENWDKRGVHAIEAASLVGSWFRATDSRTAPMDRDGGGHWFAQFERIGQFEATFAWDGSDQATPQTSTIEPVNDLTPPALLYRGAPESMKARWSWTDDPKTARAFVDLFCPDDGKIWVAEAETVLGVIHAQIENSRPPFEQSFTEWIVVPRESTIREFVA